jgi:two-component system, sensor histidine kinase YesM
MRNLSLYQKLFLSYLVVILLSLGGVGIFTYRASSGQLSQLVEGQLSQIVRNAVHHTDLYIRSYERSMVSFLNSNNVKRFIDLPAGENGYPFYELRKNIRELSIEPAFVRNPEISAITLLSFSGNALYFFNGINGESFKGEEVRKQLDFYKRATDKDGSLNVLNYSILPDQQNQMITLVRRIRGLASSEPQGILAIELRAAELSSLWKGIDLGQNGYFFITDDSGSYVYHPDAALIGRSLPEPVRQQLLEAEEKVFVSGKGKDARMFMSRHSAYGSWRLVVSTSLKEARSPVDAIRWTAIVVGIFTLILALWLAYSYTKAITGPIRMLKKAMQQTEKGNWATIPLPDHRDEIVELMSRYNLMVNRLSELVREVYEAELRHQESRMERQKAELQSLQLQINPHFLYNTLETIVCYAAIRNSKEIFEIVKAMSYMLRYSVQVNVEEITVANELKHVLHYLVVLQHRIGREFEADVAIHPDYLLRSMVRLTMQPLVENAFHHAFPDGVEDYHTIRIDAGEDNGIFWVSVEDNGVGIDEEKLRELREQLGANRLADRDDAGKEGVGGIGILNVHRRIQMVFGEEYGLRIESELDRGTKMMMIMPATGMPQNGDKDGRKDLGAQRGFDGQ